MNHESEFMHDESYKFDNDRRHGVALEFIQRDRTSCTIEDNTRKTLPAKGGGHHDTG